LSDRPGEEGDAGPSFSFVVMRTNGDVNVDDGDGIEENSCSTTLLVTQLLLVIPFFKEEVVAVVDAFEASAESLFSGSWNVGFRRAGWGSLGGALGGGTVTDKGSFPSIASSYFKALIPSSSRS